MPNINNIVPNFFTLDDDINNLRNAKNYKIDRETGEFARTAKGATGKITRFFREHLGGKGVREQNQRTLDELAQRMTRKYGDCEITQAIRGQMGVFAEGRKIFNCRDISVVADEIMQTVRRSAQESVAPMTTALQGLFAGNAQPTTSAVPMTIKNAIPTGVSNELGQVIIRTALASLTVNQATTIANLMNSQGAADINNMLKFSDRDVARTAAIIARNESYPAAQKDEMAHLVKSMEILKNTIAMTNEALRLQMPVITGNQNWLPNGMPDSTVSFATATQAHKAIMADLGVANPVTLIKNHVPRHVVECDDKLRLLRNNDMVARLMPDLCKQEFGTTPRDFYNAIFPIYRTMSPTMSEGDKKALLLDAAKHHISRSPAMLNMFNRLSALIEQVVKEEVNKLEDLDVSQKQTMLRQAFRNTVLVAFTGSLAPMFPEEGAPRAAFNNAMDALFARENFDQGADLSNLLNKTCPAWRSLVQ